MFNNTLHAIDSSIIAEWPLENSLNDLTRNVNDLGMNGGIPFNPNTNMPIGRTAAGPFTVNNNLMTTTKFNNLFNTTANNWTMTCYAKINVLDGGIIFSFFNNSDVSKTWVIRTLATGSLRLVANNAFLSDSTAGTLTTGEWYFIAWTWDGTTSKAYAQKANALPVSTAVCNTTGAAISNVGTFRFGEENVGGLEFPLNGYIKGIKVYNKVLTSFPGA